MKVLRGAFEFALPLWLSPVASCKSYQTHTSEPICMNMCRCPLSSAPIDKAAVRGPSRLDINVTMTLATWKNMSKDKGRNGGSGQRI